MAELYEELQSHLGIFNKRSCDIFDDSPFCATTFNLGPKASTVVHRDSKNLIGGICAIIVLGLFNHRTSGHLILHDIQTIIEVRSGDIIYIPSAGIAHSNSSLKTHEDRCSIVQYTAGGLFRRVWSDASKTRNTSTELGLRRWEECLQLLGTIDDAKSRQERVKTVQNAIIQGKSTLLPPTF